MAAGPGRDEDPCGRCKGLEVRDLAPEQVQALIEHWLPTAKANAKPTADDRRLIAALEWWAGQQEKANDNVPLLRRGTAKSDWRTVYGLDDVNRVDGERRERDAHDLL